MRARKVFTFVMVAVFCGGVGMARAQGMPGVPGMPAAQAQVPAWYGFANAWIASHAQRLKGTAPREARKNCEGDINGDGHGDVVVIYSIDTGGEGGDWKQFATVLTSTGQGYGASTPKEVGGKGERIIEACTITAKSVELSSKSYGPQDAPCCPSVIGKVRFGFEKGVLVDASAPAPAPSGK